MALEWLRENPPHWDRHKAAIVGNAPPGVFDLGEHADGELISCDWWRVEEAGEVLGYGWMDVVWGDGEILLAVDPAHRKRGIGSFILDHLEHEAVSHGLNYLYNVVPSGHPDVEGVTRWLRERGFEPSGQGRLLRRGVRAAQRSD